MRFEAAPPNPFAEFIDTYYESCRQCCPKLVSMAGKWTFEDLIPGLSDFDSRLIFDDDTTGADWAEASLAVGQVHSKLARDRPEWRRILEHLPGVNMTRAELCDPVSYTPEAHLWTVYAGEVEMPDPHGWTAADEYFHLKKFATYFGPYQRGIDPAVNLGPYENKYVLHSRYMHYFAPPVQAAVALVGRGPVRGKLKAIERAGMIFPHPETIVRVLEAVAVHYEIAPDYEDAMLVQIESELETYLCDVLRIVCEHVSVAELDPLLTPEQLRARVSAAVASPVSKLFDTVKFSRLMRGRLLFFAENIPWFDSEWLIRNELARIVPWFYTQALEAYGNAALQRQLSADQVLCCLSGTVLSPELALGLKRFAEVASEQPRPGNERECARRVADVFEPAQLALECLMQNLRSRVESRM
jgi:hypothetical protein